MDEIPPNRRADLFRIALLMLFAAGVHFWLMAHTEVIARDSIDFIRCAVRLDEQPWGEVLRSTDQMPGYPLLILGMSKLVRPFCGRPLTDTMVLCAQLVSVLPGGFTVA